MFHWQQIRQLQGTTLHTVRQGRPFEIISVTGDVCRIQVGSTGKVRPIRRQEFERAVALGPISSLNTSILRERGASEANPAYVLAILRVIDG